MNQPTGPVQLPGLDAAFLGLEAPRQSGHVGSLVVLDPSGLDVPFDLAHLRALVAERLPRLGHFRRRLKHVPLGLDRPYWVDDVDFDLEYHVRELALAAPGTQDILLDAVARVHERPLDLTRPLWECYVISGLEGDKVAVYTKVHHAMIDGVTGVELFVALIDLEPGELPGDPAPFEPAPEPSALGLLARAAVGMTKRPKDVVALAVAAARYLPAMAFQTQPMLSRLIGRSGAFEAAATPLLAPATPFNTRISAQRRIGLARLPLEDLRTIKSAFGVSVNDVVIALCAASIRDWLQRHGGATNAPLVTMVPVALAGDRSGAAGNSVTAMFTPVPVHLEDPVERLVAAHASSRAAKEHGAAVPQELYEGGIKFAPPILLSRAMRTFFELGVLRRVRTFNTVISNIPGPDITLYLGGAVVETIYPLSIIVDGMGLNITLQGLGTHLGVGVVGCRQAVPDAQSVADGLLAEIDVLLEAAKKVR